MKSKALLLLALLALPACKYYGPGPALPEARVTAEAAPLFFRYGWEGERWVLRGQEPEVKVRFRSAQDLPSAYVTGYSAADRSSSGEGIVPRTNLRQALHVPAFASDVTLSLPGLSQELGSRGAALLRRLPDQAEGTELQAELMFYGEDDNYNQLGVRVDLWIRFEKDGD